MRSELEVGLEPDSVAGESPELTSVDHAVTRKHMETEVFRRSCTSETSILNAWKVVSCRACTPTHASTALLVQKELAHHATTAH